MQSSWPSVGFYILFGIFVFYQQLHVKEFKGGSEGVRTALGISVALAMITGLLYLYNLGLATTWWAPFAIFFVGLIGMLPGVALERLIGAPTLSLIGFVGWPVCAFYMFEYLPKT